MLIMRTIISTACIATAVFGAASETEEELNALYPHLARTLSLARQQIERQIPHLSESVWEGFKTDLIEKIYGVHLELTFQEKTSGKPDYMRDILNPDGGFDFDEWCTEKTIAAFSSAKSVSPQASHAQPTRGSVRESAGHGSDRPTPGAYAGASPPPAKPKARSEPRRASQAHGAGHRAGVPRGAPFRHLRDVQHELKALQKIEQANHARLKRATILELAENGHILDISDGQAWVEKMLSLYPNTNGLRDEDHQYESMQNLHGLVVRYQMTPEGVEANINQM